MQTMSQRHKVLNLYKTLLYMGREYPMGYKWFRDRCYTAFDRNRNEKDPKKVEEMIGRGDFVLKEIEALYRLKKYRTLKRRYYKEDNDIN